MNYDIIQCDDMIIFDNKNYSNIIHTTNYSSNKNINNTRNYVFLPSDRTREHTDTLSCHTIYISFDFNIRITLVGQLYTMLYTEGMQVMFKIFLQEVGGDIEAEKGDKYN